MFVPGTIVILHRYYNRESGCKRHPAEEHGNDWQTWGAEGQHWTWKDVGNVWINLFMLSDCWPTYILSPVSTWPLMSNQTDDFARCLLWK